MKGSRPGCKVVRRRLADGTIKEYRYERKAAPPTRQAADSVGALLVAYRQSPEYTRLRDSTKRTYGYYLRHLEDYAAVPAASMKRRDLLDARDAIAGASGHGAANVFMRICSRGN